MDTKLIDGKLIAGNIRDEIAKEVEQFVQLGNPSPHLTAIIVGNDPASEVYVRNKGRACESVGMTHNTIKMESSISTQDLLDVIKKLNIDKSISGILIQLPLPKHIDSSAILAAIDINKDVDGLSNNNLGALLKGEPNFVPATPLGVRELLYRNGVEIPGKNVVVVGRSTLVGKPLSALLSMKSDKGNATVTLAHSATTDLSSVTKKADILIVAIGIAEFIDGTMIKEGVVIIDVGINRVDDINNKNGYKLFRDVNFESVLSKASMVTPVPGGVGPMTIAMVVSNTLRAAKLNS